MGHGGSDMRLGELHVARPASHGACARRRWLPGEALEPSRFRALLLLPPRPAPTRAHPALRLPACVRSHVARGVVPSRNSAPNRCWFVAARAHHSSETTHASTSASRGRSASPRLSLPHHVGHSARLRADLGTASPPSPRLCPRRWPARGLLAAASPERSAAAARAERWRTGPLPPRHAA